MTYGIRYLFAIHSLPARFISGFARVPLINQSGSLIPHSPFGGGWSATQNSKLGT